MKLTWPSHLWIVRHGESLGNVARDAAMASDMTRIDIAHRDIDVPLSDLGSEQSRSVGLWFAALPEIERPEVVLSSPYRRALETASAIVEEADLERACLSTDERLREKEFGILDRLTSMGIKSEHPEQAEFRQLLGKFYHRPPGGESWCDVILRLRSVLDTVSLHYEGRRVLIVAHQVVVLCLRYIIEKLDEDQILAIDRDGDVANCAVTEYRAQRSGGGDIELKLVRYNFVAPLLNQDTEVTAEPRAKEFGR
ncbi:histidine phosphatase family protein [Aurantimonas endophytica]|nr:histidine phosphatase family protein [Aurantimonas endophytica]MCO6405519.1 histidine phosphatase family protein [Aurantimonas endophytica]